MSSCIASDLRFLLPTSNIYKGLFLKVEHVDYDRCMSIMPANLKSQIILCINKDLWSVKHSLENSWRRQLVCLMKF